MSKQILQINKENCEYLESLNLSYKEMLDYCYKGITVGYLKVNFKRFGIHHKTKSERIKDYVKDNMHKSSRQLAMECKCNKNLIIILKRRIKKGDI